MLNITGRTKQLGVIGDPISHSFSPKLHNYISNALGNDYIYSAWNVKSAELENAINGIRALSICGINVTAPHKVAVMKYLDETDPEARLLGSVNTVVNRDGKLTGYNTDSEGFYMALKAADIEVCGKNVLILGAGGVVKPTLMRMVRENPKRVTLLNRTHKKAESIADMIYEQLGARIETAVCDTDFDVVINTTSAGMAPQLDILPTDDIEEIKDIDFINENTAVVDMIYNPPQTRFLEEAKKRGAKTVNGLDMLIYQGTLAYGLFTGSHISDELVRKIKSEVFGV